MKISAFLIVLSTCLIIQPVFADEVDDAIAKLKSGDFNAKDAAYRTLGDLGGAKARQALMSAYKEEDNPALENTVVEAMAKIGGPEVEKFLLAQLAMEDASQWSSAARGLGLLKSTRAVAPLCAALKKQYMWREEAAKALGEIGDLRAVDALVAIVPASQKDVSDIGSRVAVAQALGSLGDPRAAKGLLLLLGDEDSTVRDAAASALENVGWSARTDGEKMLVALQMKDWDALSAAGEKAIPVLILGLDREETTDAAREMLVPFGAKAVKALINATVNHHPESTKGKAIAETLAEIGPDSFTPLAAALKDPTWNTRATAVYALGKLGDARAVNPIAAFLVADANSRSAIAVMDAFQELGDPAKEKLYSMLSGKDTAARYWAAVVLGSMAEEVAQRVAEIGRASKNRDVRGACAWVLERAHQEDLQSASAELLGADPDTAARDYGKLLGKEKSFWLLLAAMERSGDKDMATSLLNSGDSELQDAAEMWAQAHGYTVMRY